MEAFGEDRGNEPTEGPHGWTPLRPDVHPPGRRPLVEVHDRLSEVRGLESRTVRRDLQDDSDTTQVSVCEFLVLRVESNSPDARSAVPLGVSGEECLDDGRQQGAAGEIHVRRAGQHGELALRQESHRLDGVLDEDKVGVADQDQHRHQDAS